MAKPWHGKSVVIVDDSANVRDELKKTFESIGMRVVGTAENGVEGLAVIRQMSPELVSLDVIMPEMDGIECFRKLRQLNPDQKIVMISWLGAEPKILDNLKDIIPSYCFQAKPVAAGDLERRLELVYNPASAPAAIPPPPKGIKSTLDEDAALLDLGVKVS
jgi:two-component system chemotaxis response regulator CheY